MAEPTVATILGPRRVSPVLHASGVKVKMDYREYLAQAGYVFTSASNNLGSYDRGETGADNQDVELTEPGFCFDIPKGLTVIPLWANVAFEVITGTDNILAIVVSENTAFNTGGIAALAVQNTRTDNPRASAVTNLRATGESPTDITLDTLVAPRVLWVWSSPTDGTDGDPFKVEWKPEHLTHIVGPGCFAFYSHAITTETNYRATFAWAEIPSGLVIQ